MKRVGIITAGDLADFLVAIVPRDTPIVVKDYNRAVHAAVGIEFDESSEDIPGGLATLFGSGITLDD